MGEILVVLGGTLVVGFSLLCLMVFRSGVALRHAEQAIAFEREISGGLLEQAAGLDRLVAALARLSDDLDGSQTAVLAAHEACGLVGADAAFVLEPNRRGGLALAAAASARGTPPPADLDLQANPLTALERHYGGRAHAVEIGEPGMQPSLLAVIRGGAPLSPLEQAQLRVLADFTGRATQSARLFTLARALRDEAEERERERSRLSDRLLHAEESERRRLALALHDGPQQTLAGIALMLRAAADALEDDDRRETQRILAVALERSREIGRGLRQLTFALEPITLRDHGFTAAFTELADQLAEAHPVRVEIDAAAVDALDRKIQVCLYRVAQEAVANAIKHSGGGRVHVRAWRDEHGGAVLEVRDDGSGAASDAFARGGLHRGVDAMRERAAGIGAAFGIDSRAGEGTTVRVTVPAHQIDEPEVAA